MRPHDEAPSRKQRHDERWGGEGQAPQRKSKERVGLKKRREFWVDLPQGCTKGVVDV